MSSNILIRLETVSITYPVSGKVIKDINLEVLRGEFVAIMGRSGSGKSSLINIIGLLDSPTSGNYYYNGVDVSRLNHKHLSRLRMNEIGFVFQNFHLLPRMSVRRNICLPMIYAGKDAGFRSTNAGILMRMMQISHRSEYRPAKLSGGERQRVAIARALANDPGLIIADEPTGNLDSQTGEMVMNCLCELHRGGKTLIVVTHDKSIADYAQRVITMHDGEILNDQYPN